MYCGEVVEMAPVAKIFGDRVISHPYTEGLLNPFQDWIRNQVSA
ncbi:MAG: hypothetical protein ACLR23_17990 [Clostridia bacterium]